MSKKSQSVYKKKNRGNKNKSIKKRGKKVWLYNIGKITVVYRTPRLHIKTMDVHGGVGATTPAAAGAAVKDDNKELAASILETIKKQAKDKVSKQELEIIEKTLNKQNVCENPPGQAGQAGQAGEAGVAGQVSSMTTKAFNGITEGAVSLGKFLLPSLPPTTTRRRNDTTIQMLWYPRASDHYRKGNSVAIPKDKIRYGDFMIYVEPERYADITAYFSDTANKVEDYFANILSGCTDSFCLKGNPIPDPYKHDVYQINNYQPDMDDKALQRTAIQ